MTKAVEISSLDLGVDGALVVTPLVRALEDGTIIGDNYLADVFRKSVEAGGPPNLDRLLRLYNNGYYGAALVKHGTGPDSPEHSGGFASGEEAGGRTAGEEEARVMDWLERHKISQGPDGRYIFYHATPKTALKGIRESGLRAGSLLEEDPSSAAFFAARDRDLKRSQVVVLTVPVRPHEIRVGQWAELRTPLDIGKLSKHLAHVHDQQEHQVGDPKGGMANKPSVRKARVYVDNPADVPEGYYSEQGPRGGTYYETRPHLKTGDRVVVTYNGEVGTVVPNEDLEGSDLFEVMLESPYGAYSGKFSASDLKRVAPAKKPPKGQEERRKQRRNKVVLDVLDQFGKDIRAAKPDFTPPNDYYRNGYKTEYPISIGYTQELFNRYVTNDDIAIYVPVGSRQEAALSLNRLLNYVAKMPPEAIQDLRKHVKKVVLSPITYPKGEHVWGTMDGYGELVVYPTVKAENPDVRYTGEEGKFHGKNPPLPDIAVARVLTHETGHAVYNSLERMVPVYRAKVNKFWDEYEKAGGNMPADNEHMSNVLAENDIPLNPMGWEEGFSTFNALKLARYDHEAPKLPSYIIPYQYQNLLPREKKEGADPSLPAWYGKKDDYSWDELPPKLKVALLDEQKRSGPVTEYGETNAREHYAEAYEHYRWGVLPSEHIMYSHFEELPRLEKWLSDDNIVIKKVFHRHPPAEWNNDEGLNHAHADAERGHSHA